jgi:osmotically-inducible protein OsmY
VISRERSSNARSRGFRLQAEVLILIAMLSACGATTSRTTDDPTTTTQVKIALLNDARVGGLRLGVKTFQGVVTLSGTVPSDADAQQAVAVARRLHGVRRVISELKIQPQ